MLALVLAIAVAQAPGHRLFRQPNLPRGAFAFFEAMPASGFGATSACSCTNVAGARGETSSTTRANSLDCRKGGPWVTSGVAVGDVVTCGSNLPRVVRDVDGTLGIEAWGPFTQDLLRTDELGNAAWTSTEVPTSNDATAPDNTVTADRLNDTSAAVQSCTTQAVATTSATVHEAGAWVRGGSWLEAQVKMVGTGSATGDCTATVTALNTSTWNYVWCKSPAAYGGTLTAVTISVCVGDAVGDTGNIYAWRVNHQVNFPSVLTYPPPSLQSVAASSTTSYERVAFTLPVAMSSTTGSNAVTFTPAWSSGLGSPVVGPQLLWYDSSARAAYGPASANALRAFDGLNDVGNSFSWTAATSVRVWSTYTGSTMQVNDGADTASGSFDGTFGGAALTSLSVGGSTSAATSAFGVVSRVCADPATTRCR